MLRSNTKKKKVIFAFCLFPVYSLVNLNLHTRVYLFLQQVPSYSLCITTCPPTWWQTWHPIQKSGMYIFNNNDASRQQTHLGKARLLLINFKKIENKKRSTLLNAGHLCMSPAAASLLFLPVKVPCPARASRAGSGHRARAAPPRPPAEPQSLSPEASGASRRSSKSVLRSSPGGRAARSVLPSALSAGASSAEPRGCPCRAAGLPVRLLPGQAAQQGAQAAPPVNGATCHRCPWRRPTAARQPRRRHTPGHLGGRWGAGADGRVQPGPGGGSGGRGHPRGGREGAGEAPRQPPPRPSHAPSPSTRASPHFPRHFLPRCPPPVPVPATAGSRLYALTSPRAPPLTPAPGWPPPERTGRLAASPCLSPAASLPALRLCLPPTHPQPLLLLCPLLLPPPCPLRWLPPVCSESGSGGRARGPPPGGEGGSGGGAAALPALRAAARPAAHTDTCRADVRGDGAGTGAPTVRGGGDARNYGGASASRSRCGERAAPPLRFPARPRGWRWGTGGGEVN